MPIYSLSQGGHIVVADSYKIEKLQVSFLQNNSDGTVQNTTRYFENKYIRMNWGWDGASDDIWFVASDAADWLATYTNLSGNFTNDILFESNGNRRMFKQN